jgi:hypothetical protein
LLNLSTKPDEAKIADEHDGCDRKLTWRDLAICPDCGGAMQHIAIVPRTPRRRFAATPHEPASTPIFATRFTPALRPVFSPPSAPICPSSLQALLREQSSGAFSP